MNFLDFKIKRVITHRINEKTAGTEYTNSDPSYSLLTLSDKSIEMIKQRLDKIYYSAKSFNLEVLNTLEGGFFGLCRRTKGTLDTQFIELSQEIAENLAESQKMKKAPPCDMLFIEAEANNGKAVWIVIKADYNEVLRVASDEVSYLNDTILSADLKLLKAGIIYEKDDIAGIDSVTLKSGSKSVTVEKVLNERYGFVLLDNKFSLGSLPSQYFCGDFLGFSLDNSPKIQSKRFFDATETFIKDNFHDVDELTYHLQGLHRVFQFKDDEFDIIIKPEEFGAEQFESEDLQASYKTDVCYYLPREIHADVSMIRSKIDWRVIKFATGISVKAPTKTFNLDVQLIRMEKDLEALDYKDPGYTIIKVLGQPFKSK